MKNTTESIEVHTAKPDHKEGGDLLAPDLMMMVLTWVTFLLLLGILYKFAWKPILAALDERETTIRESLDNADKVTADMENIEQTRKQVLEKADEEAKSIVDRGRKGAVAAAKIIEGKAKEEAKITLSNAVHEIDAKKDKAHDQLKNESVNIAVALAEKILDENLDDKKHRKLIDKFIKDFNPDEYEN